MGEGSVHFPLMLEEVTTERGLPQNLEAEASLLEAGLTKKKRKARRDRVAAQILLQTYLDAGCPAETKNESL